MVKTAQEDPLTTPSGYLGAANNQVISLLLRFKQIRQATRCFDYIMKSKPKFGDAKLFKIIDETNDGLILLVELSRAMESIGEVRSDKELRHMINNANPYIDGNEVINYTEFILDRALCGVRDLISDDRMSIIDTEDMDMQIDYKTFADMLLGKPL
ncbi:hypothetical protein HJC23_005907 [Cyclotella cryptica]|uniref:Calmodulin n=1 Tax=Cyclotella cryptica TaxID=29204 RepID=A0ABD3QZK6_9STRA